jgi:uncharacterized protein YaeQ
MSFDIALSIAERADGPPADVTRTLVVARHPSETLEHVALRVLAWCVLWEEGLEPGPGLCDGEAPDLVAKDARGDTLIWVACGRVPWEKVRKALSQASGARVVAFFADERRALELEREVAELPRVPKEIGRVEAYLADGELVRALSKDARRQAWTVTVVDGHVYVDADGASVDGPVTKRELGPNAGK